MVQLIHRSPIGPLEIPGVVGSIPPGEPFEAPDWLAETLLEQTELYELVEPEAIRVNRRSTPNTDAPTRDEDTNGPADKETQK